MIIDMEVIPYDVYKMIIDWLYTDDIEHEELLNVELGYISAINICEEDAIIMRLKLGI